MERLQMKELHFQTLREVRTCMATWRIFGGNELRQLNPSQVSNENLYVWFTQNPDVCSRIAGIFLAKGWDWKDFLENGIDLEIVEQTNDAMANQVVEYVKNGREQ